MATNLSRILFKPGKLADKKTSILHVLPF